MNDQTHAGHPTNAVDERYNCWACDKSHPEIVSHCCRTTMTDTRPASSLTDPENERDHEWRCDGCGRLCVSVYRNMSADAFMKVYGMQEGWAGDTAGCRFCGDVSLPKSETCPECGDLSYDDRLALVVGLMKGFSDDPILLLDSAEDQQRIYISLEHETERKWRKQDVEWALSVLRQYNADGGGSYRTLIYSYFNFGADSYSAVYTAGGMELTNALPLEVPVHV